MVKQFLILDEPKTIQDNYHGGIREVFYSETRYLNIDLKKVAYFTNKNREDCVAVVVPGVIVSDVYQTEHGVSAVDIEPIRDSGLKAKVEELITKQENGKLCFW